jgi:flagellar biosynthetic protein FliR
MNLTILSPAALETFFLIAVRASTLLMVAPPLATRGVPALVKIGLSLLLALLLTPLLVPATAAPLSFERFLLGVAMEILTGLLLAFAVTLIFGAVQFAAAALGLQFGFSLANAIDPMLETQETVIGQFYALLIGLIFFTINGHHHLLAGLARSFDAAPPAGLALFGAADAAGLAILIDRSAVLFTAALRIALPTMGALLLADVAMGIIARSAPQTNIYFVGLPVKIVIGLAAILLGLPLLVGAIERLLAGLARDMVVLIGGA